MKVQEFKGAIERKIMIAMVVNTTVLGRIASSWNGEGFNSEHANKLARICIRHYHKFKKAPDKEMQAIFDTWADKQPERNREIVESVRSLWGGLSDEYEQTSDEYTNAEFLIDLAGEHFNKNRLAKMARKVGDAISAGEDLSKVQEIVDKYGKKTELGKGAAIDLLLDEEAVRSTFNVDIYEPIITYPGALGKFYGRMLRRGGFITFVGPEKSGKSMYLLDMAFQAMIQRKKVAYFQVGDLTETEFKLRFFTRISQNPVKPIDDLAFPIAISKKKGEPMADVKFEARKYEKGLTANVAWRACEKFMSRRIKSKDSYFRLSVHANETIDIGGVSNILDTWIREGFTPDVTIIDYADILALPSGHTEQRHKINETWSKMRALSMEKHCLLVTATQSNRASYDAKLITRKHASEDKRKDSHVTGAISINRNDDERAQGISRLYWTVTREEGFVPQVHVAGNLALASPCLVSCF